MTKAWADLTKEERGARIREGREKAKMDRTGDAPKATKAADPSPVDLATAIATAMANVAQAQKAGNPKDPRDMTPEELKVEHERLQASLEALPYVAESLEGAKPGTKIGEGLTREYVPYTREWFLDVAARRKDRNQHNGKDAELTWPEYQIHNVDYMGSKPWFDLTINGCRFTIRPGITCQLPTPFYDKYREHLRAGQENDKRFAKPTNPDTSAGYMHVNPDTGLAVILGKGPLASAVEREQNDRQA